MILEEVSYYLGIDIGGTKIEVLLGVFMNNPHSVSDSDLKVLFRDRIATERDRGYENVCGRLSNFVLEILSKNNLKVKEVSAIGVGLPGAIDPHTQFMKNGNSQIFVDKDFSRDFQKLLGENIPIYINNDANCFALAEVQGGCGLLYEKDFQVPRSQQIGLGIILGTGTGAGLVIKSKIYSGSNGGALEAGHSTLVFNGRDCYCGRKGCAEQYLSGSGISLFHKDQWKAQKIFEQAGSGDTYCEDIVNEYKNYLKEFLVNLTNLFDPHYFVLGGGVSNQALIYEGLELSAQEYYFLPHVQPKIYKNQLGDSAGVFGALYWGRQMYTH